MLDVEKEALLVLAHGLAACGDSHAILTFTSRRRSWVRVETVKDFDEPMGRAIERRIGALKPGYYTRIGAAVRHASAGSRAPTAAQKLLLVLTDGKPNDVDHYEGRFAVEDTRKSVQEARRLGVARLRRDDRRRRRSPMSRRCSAAAATPSSATSATACRAAGDLSTGRPLTPENPHMSSTG